MAISDARIHHVAEQWSTSLICSTAKVDFARSPASERNSVESSYRCKVTERSSDPRWMCVEWARNPGDNYVDSTAGLSYAGE